MMMIKFLVLSLVVISPISINGDKDLMTKECHNTRAPTICMQCLESNPKSIHADAVGIAGIVIECLYNNLDTLSSMITKVLSTEKGKSPAIKTVLEICYKDLSEVSDGDILSEAKSGVDNGDYERASHLVKLALQSPLSCKDNFEIAKFQSLHLTSQINIYAQLSEAASRIIDRL